MPIDNQAPQHEPVASIPYAIAEIDVVKTLTPVAVQVVGGGRVELVPAGTCGTVVLVYPGAYEVEFALPTTGDWALATVPASAVELHWKAPKRSQSSTAGT